MSKTVGHFGSSSRSCFLPAHPPLRKREIGPCRYTAPFATQELTDCRAISSMLTFPLPFQERMASARRCTRTFLAVTSLRTRLAAQLPRFRGPAVRGPCRTNHASIAVVIVSCSMQHVFRVSSFYGCSCGPRIYSYSNGKSNFAFLSLF